MTNKDLGRVFLIDPSIFTPAYDLYLADGLKQAGASIEWLGSRDVWGMLDGYPGRPTDYFYKATNSLFGRSHSPLRQGFKLAEHVIGMAMVGNFARQHGVKLLHFQWSPVPGLDHLFWGRYKQQGFKIVFTVHNLLPHRPSLGDRENYVRLYRLADRLVVHDRRSREGLTGGFGLPAEKITQINMPALPLPGQATIGPEELKRQLGIDGQRIILCFGFIENYKGFDLAVEAMASAKNLIPPDVVLVIAGRDDAGQAGHLKELIRKYGLEKRIILRTGFMEQAYLKSLMAAADLCLFPYRRISQSGALLTAMAEGKAVVGFDVGGIGETVEQGRNGMVVKPGDAATLGKAVAQIFREPGLCQSMGRESLALVAQRHSYLEAGRRTLRLYQELLP